MTPLLLRSSTCLLLSIGTSACSGDAARDGGADGAHAPGADVTLSDGGLDADAVVADSASRDAVTSSDGADAAYDATIDAIPAHDVHAFEPDTEAPDATPRVTPLPTTNVLFGTFAGRTAGQSAADADRALEAVMQRKADIHRVYNSWDTAQPSSTVLDDVAHGRIPLLSISMNTASTGALTWASVASGAHDSEIRAHAAGLASLRVPLFLIVNHEPEEPSTHHGTPAEYVSMVRHYVGVFRAQHVTNVTFGWIPVSSSFSDTTADAYYPGDDVIDWVGADGYNWFGCHPGGSTRWRSVEDIFAPLLAWNAASHHKRVILAEWGSIEDPTQATHKPTWLADVLATLQRHPEIGVVSYFDTHGTCPWWLDSTPASENAYRTLGLSAYVHGNANAWLRASVTTGTAPLTVSFDASGSAGFASQAGNGLTGWTLDFGDGSPVVHGRGAPTTPQVHAYAVGSHTAALTVTDATARSNTDHVVIEAR